MRKDSARVWAIVGAIAVPLAALLGLEYLGRMPASPEVSLPPPATAMANPHSALPEPALLAPPPAPAAPRYAPGTYRCMSQGRAVYTDKPERDCATSAEVRPVNAAPAAAGIAPAKPYQQQLAELEQAQAAEATRTAVTAPSPAPQPSRAARCQALWADIQRLDSLLHQPHSAAMGDHWAAERRRLSDLRYAEHC
ncbi:hypothetical protein [Uliginosibacterium sp. 31-12]|uniref:hypothetical protein n=1 Tax=Uliginosibacterium sp. 31-12 TaxID=3062781 RepID=UPI0026E30B11|nr:hypothetical protein [Uliginosibacterium sp. 31-12]MDO6387331.1 hypothetical protein [Uliginosibacterium sp. 31-12]